MRAGSSWSIGNGFATGSDTFIDPANRLTYLGQLRWAPPTGRASVVFNTVITRPDFDANESFAFYNVYDLIFSYKLSDRLTCAIDATYSNIDDVPGTGSTNWYGASQYLTYQINDKLAATTRFELFEDTSGFRTGSEGLYTAFTTGLTWKPTSSLIVRPSVRYDNNADSAPFQGNSNLFTATLDVIVRW